MEYNFDEIRCYNNEEVNQVLTKLTDEKQFMHVLSTVYPLLPKEVLRQRMSSFHKSYQFQTEMIYPFLKYLEANKTKGIDLIGLNKIDPSESYLYISNHRDIILDSALLCAKLIDNKMDTVEIAIGDNLLIFPWIKELVRANKSFIVQRGLNARQILESSKRLSAYLYHTINHKKQSIWIAQREGRAKDSNDRTQEALLKMFNMAGEGNFADNMCQLHLCPLSISYEYDPCDYLKAKEMQQKRDNPLYKKHPSDDLINMQTGVMGYKGKVVYHITGDIRNELKSIAETTSNKNEQISLTAELIDKRIHAAYSIYVVNKIAYDLFLQTTIFSGEYSLQEKLDFEKYLNLQIAKIDIEHKDEDFLLRKMLEMYANPLINHLKAIN